MMRENRARHRAFASRVSVLTPALLLSGVCIPAAALNWDQYSADQEKPPAYEARFKPPAAAMRSADRGGRPALAMGGWRADQDAQPGDSVKMPPSIARFLEPVVWEQEYPGYVTVPDPSNWWVGYRRTGEDCAVSLRPAGEGPDLWVRVNFWNGEKLARADALRGVDFYLGELPHNQVFVLQTDQGKKPVAVWITGYDSRGRLVIGPDYGPKDKIKIPGARECSIFLKRDERRRKRDRSSR